jgi:hypothetical protein
MNILSYVKYLWWKTFLSDPIPSRSVNRYVRIWFGGGLDDWGVGPFYRLTKGIAELYIRNPNSSTLDWAVRSCYEIDRAAAEMFIGQDVGHLDLMSLGSLSNEAADSLSRYGGKRLSLGNNFLQSSDDSYKIPKGPGAGQFTGKFVLSDRAADRLSRFEGALDLFGLTELSDAVAECLSAHRNVRPTNLDKGLSFGSLKRLSVSAATQIAKYKGSLSIYSLTEMSETTVEALCNHEGSLELCLQSLSPTLAQILITNKGPLKLPSVASLSSEVAEILASHEYELELLSKFKYSDAVRDILRKN